MTENTLEYIKKNNLFTSRDKLLLAISGGIDSMVMLDIFMNLDLKFSVAHCNFALRGEESDADQKFVESLCLKNEIKFYTQRFNTEKFAGEKGLSIQMAARELRYSWFEKIRTKYSYKYIVLAHNSDDILETFFINLSRGTGLKGLTGIKPKNKHIVRPLLSSSREDIMRYAEENNVKYREDSSNIETKYKRNNIRHKILPLFNNLNPSFSSSLESTIRKLSDAQCIVDEMIENTRQDILNYDDDIIRVKVASLLSLNPLDTYIYELFKNYGIGQLQVNELRNLLTADSGKLLQTVSHAFLKDRDNLIISALTEQEKEPEIIISEDELDKLEKFEFNILPVDQLSISGDNSIAYLDYNKIKFPITVRPWRQGDRFYPFGMKGGKKLSDFFVDLKIPLNEKDSILIFLSDDKIFWVAGYRIDNRFRVDEATRKVLILRWK